MSGTWDSYPSLSVSSPVPADVKKSAIFVAKFALVANDILVFTRSQKPQIYSSATYSQKYPVHYYKTDT